LAVITLIYSSLVTIRQIDTKALVAYSSVAHMAVCILGIFSNNLMGIEGAILLSLAHGLVSPALFILVGGVLYNRYHTRIINYYRGLTLNMPIFSLIFFIFIIFNASAPLSLNFIGEFLALTGIFIQSPVLGVFASTGIVFSAIYSIFLFNRINFLGFSPYLNLIHKKNNSIENWQGDLTRLEFLILLPLLLLTIIFGLFPNLILDSLHYSVSNLIYNVNL
jgi:NADH-ubiquinone oxidoreductase chain 4